MPAISTEYRPMCSGEEGLTRFAWTHCAHALVGSANCVTSMGSRKLKHWLLNPLRDRGKLAGAFGSFGWSGEGSAIIEANLKNLKLKVFDENFFIKFSPNAPEEEKAREFGLKFGKALLENAIN